MLLSQAAFRQRISSVLQRRSFGRIVSASYCSARGEEPKRRGFIISSNVNKKQEESAGSLILREKFSCDVSQVVKDAAYPLKAGHVLMQPGGLGRDDDGLVNDLCVIGVSDCGQKEPISCGSEQPSDWEAVDDTRSFVRKAVQMMKELGCRHLQLDTFGDNCITAEAALSATYSYKKHRGQRTESNDDPGPVQIGRIDARKSCAAWDLGVALGGAEVQARDLMERPANLCTPTWFCQNAAEALGKLKNVQHTIYEEAWIREQGMSGLLAVSRGSVEQPRLLVANYNGKQAADSAIDLCLVGKGVTFDSGGISIKPSAKMADMRADMGGAAVTLSVFLAASQLQLPINIGLCIPLCENMPDGGAVKPGDVIEMMSGLTVRVDNTDAEGRLLLADALHYSCERMKPQAVIDVATLTGAIVVALGNSRAGLYANRKAQQLADRLVDCGQRRGDLLHQMPLDRVYRAAVRDSSGIADLSNIGSVDRMGGSCTAAAFLSHFVPATVPWMHIDMAGVMQKGEAMTGRPSRALLQLIVDLAAAGK